MKTAIETMVDFIMLILMVLISVCFIILHLKEQKARNFHAMAVDEIENSHFSNRIESGLLLEAENQGYDLTIVDKSINGEPIAEVILKYKNEIPLFRFQDDTRSIRGTAR